MKSIEHKEPEQTYISEPVEEKPEEHIDVRALLNTFYKNPDMVSQMPYVAIYNDILNEVGQMVDALENQWMQNEIDFHLGYISMRTYCEKRIGIRDKFEESKKRYLLAMNLA